MVSVEMETGAFIDGIVGTRPNLMKMAPFARALAADGRLRLRLVHTGQHYDDGMSGVFFRELGLPEPAANLQAGGGLQGEQTARILASYEKLLASGPRPRGTVVVGDVTSTMACTLVAAKMGVPVAHIEAGLRSNDRRMPEEINRLVTDTLADLLFVSDPAGMANLEREGHSKENTWLVGNLMVDCLFHELGAAVALPVLQQLEVEPKQYAVMTLHRPSNVDDKAILHRLITTACSLADELPIVFPVHPRTRERIAALDLALPARSLLKMIAPLSYRENLSLMKSARMVLTDSGGIQEETSVLEVPCLTLRENTERPITVELGSSELVGNEPDKIRDAWRRVMDGRWKTPVAIPLWDGNAAARIVGHLCQRWV